MPELFLWFQARGSVMVKHVPLPISLVAVMVPL